MRKRRLNSYIRRKPQLLEKRFMQNYTKSRKYFSAHQYQNFDITWHAPLPPSYAAWVQGGRELNILIKSLLGGVRNFSFGLGGGGVVLSGELILLGGVT